MTQKASEVPQNSGVPTPEFRDPSQSSDTGPRTLGPVEMPVLTKVLRFREGFVNLINPRIPGPSYPLKYSENVIYANKVLMAKLLIIFSV